MARCPGPELLACVAPEEELRAQAWVGLLGALGGLVFVEVPRCPSGTKCGHCELPCAHDNDCPDEVGLSTCTFPDEAWSLPPTWKGDNENPVEVEAGHRVCSPNNARYHQCGFCGHRECGNNDDCPGGAVNEVCFPLEGRDVCVER